MSLFATKPLARILREGEGGEHQLKRSLGPVNLVALGIGAIIGAGLFAITPVATHDNAGPAVVFSFIIAAIGCAFAGMCYSEFATMIPIAGSAYTYAYATMGELLAWIIGWDLVLEYAVGAATVSVSWSNYLVRLFAHFGITLPSSLTASPLEGGLVNLPAIFVICLISVILMIGISESAWVNGCIVALKVTIVVLVIGLGWAYINRANYVPFLPPNTGEVGHFGWGHRRGNTRNGKSQKTLKGEFGELELETPRDRKATFDPKIVAKGQTRWTGFDDKIISMYARGMTTREIQGHLEEMYGIEVSPTLISNVTEAVTEEVKAWQSRPLEELYPIVYLDALMVKVRDEGHIQNKAIYVVLGVNLEGQKEVLGLWVAQTEGAKFWLQVLTELQNRGVKDIFIACVDGLKGFPEAIEAVYPRTEVQLCIVHLVRASLNYVPWKARKPVAADLQLIYRAGTVAEAEQHLAQLEGKWKAYPSVSQVWRRNWARITPFFNYPPDIRKAIYTTNSVESLNRSLRKIIKTRGGFPNEEAALKLLFLALRQAAKKWTMPIHHWREALNHFTILWPERMPALERIPQ